jgi:ABC-2 type transport system ATP-binding protein/lipopolysaccharide transport system ATP-binding protein
MAAAVIEARGLGKRYRIGSAYGGGIRDAVTDALTRRSAARSSFWALREVELAIRQGESVGMIGRNGAGKSTLLRLLTRITEPTEGIARTRGRVGTLLEVGTGFHPELTGRENVTLNGVILGMSRREVRRRFDEIVEFAGVDRFIDTPLKRYSSGMQLRLAFAVAAHLDPEILLVDEVLAVGDTEFQRRCLGRMGELAGEGRTVLFVSHDLGAIARLCPRAIWIDGGRLRHDGPTQDVVDAYIADLPAVYSVAAEEADEGAEVSVSTVIVLGPDGRPANEIRRDEPLVVEIRLRTDRARPDLDIGVVLTDERGVRVLDESLSDVVGHPTDPLPSGTGVARLVVPPILAPGRYTVRVWVGTQLEDHVNREFVAVRVRPMPEDTEKAVRRVRAVQPPVRWHVGGTG